MEGRAEERRSTGSYVYVHEDFLMLLYRIMYWLTEYFSHNLFLTEGSHTMCKRVVSSSSKASGLMSKFTKKRATCISCKAVLQRDGKFCSVVIVNISFV